MFDKVGVQPPKNIGEMIEVSAKLTKDLGGPYGIGVRGSRSWATIHPGFLSGYANFGEKDFNVADGKLKAAMNSAGSKSYHKDWVRMIQDSGPKNWSTYTWYQVGTDLGAGASAMIFDADILGYFMNGGDNKEAGNLGYAPVAANPAAAPRRSVGAQSAIGSLLLELLHQRDQLGFNRLGREGPDLFVTDHTLGIDQE